MDKKYTYLIIIFLIIASCAAFSRVAGNDFVDVDDTKYITQNLNIQSGFNPQSIQWALSAVVVGNWHPLTMFSHMLDWTLLGAHPAGHHLVNLLLHIGAVIILFLFLHKTTRNLWPSALAAALFAWHPLRVESVAWAAERKDVLSMFLGMACLYSYAFWVESNKKSHYFLCLLFFAMSLLSKPMMITLPFVLMLLDYWPLNRFPQVLIAVKEKEPAEANKKTEMKKAKKHKGHSMKEQKISSSPVNRFPEIRSLLWEKVPFIGLIIPMIFITLWAQSKDKMVIPLERLPFKDCLGNAVVSYVAYLGKIFCPMNMAVFYPFDYFLPLWKVLISGMILIVMTLAVLYYAKKLPFLFVGWFWYLGTLIPVIGLVKVGNHSIADRYTYLPSIGIMIMLLWGIQFLFPGKETFKKILLPIGSVVLIILGILTWQQCGYWKNSYELWNHALTVTQDNYLAHSNYATVMLSEGKNEEALYHINQFVQLKPKAPSAYTKRGAIYFQLGEFQNAMDDFNKAISMDPDIPEAYFNRGTLYYKLDRFQFAIEDLNRAFSSDPDDKLTNADAYYNRGNAYFKLNQYQKALEDYNNAISLKEDFTNAYSNRASLYFMQGNKELACRDAQKACDLGNCKKLESAGVEGYCR
jgi:protein O-mannosyl-transferase